MIAESIKALLGEDLLKQVENAVKGKGKDGRDIDLVVGNDGSVVPTEKFNGARTQATSAENALKTAAEALKAIGGSGDPAKIADDVKTAQETLTTLQQNHTAEITKLRRSTAVKLALGGKVHDPADIINLLDMDKIDVDDSGNLKTNLDDLLKPIKEQKAYLFTELPKGGDPAPIKGAKPAPAGGGDPAPAAASGPVIF